MQNRRIQLQTGRIQLQYRRIQLQTERIQLQRRRIQLQKPVSIIAILEAMAAQMKSTLLKSGSIPDVTSLVLLVWQGLR